MEVLLREVDHCVGLVAAYDHATGIDELHDARYEGACGSWAGRVRIVTQHELAGVQLNDGNGVRFLDRTGAGDRRIKVRRLGCWQEVERGGRPGDGLAGWARRRESGRRLDGRRGASVGEGVVGRGVADPIGDDGIGDIDPAAAHPLAAKSRAAACGSGSTSPSLP